MNKRVGVTFSKEDRVKPYEEALRLVGVEPVRISPGDNIGLDQVDGLLLTGGTDLNPALYGQPPRPETEAPDDPRDAMESALLRQALDRDMPVLAICRGLQLLNVAHGGTLVQHLPNTPKHERRDTERRDPVHEVVIAPGSRLAGVLERETAAVNSRHHQAVDRVGAGLSVAGRDEEGLVEALERSDKRFVVAVQWHPEDQASSDPVQRRLFQKFAQSL